MTTVEEVAEVLKKVTDERFAQTAAEWAGDANRMKELAVSHDEFVADAKEDHHIEGTVYLALEHDYLIKNGIVSTD